MRTIHPIAAVSLAAATIAITPCAVRGAEPTAAPRYAARPALASPSDDELVWVFDPKGFYEDWIEGRLGLGATIAATRVRNRHVAYDPSQRRNFIGNINDMKEHGNVGAGLAAWYEIAPWLSVEVARDARSDLDARNNDGDSCDGTLRLRAWSAQALFTWPDEEWIVRPYLGLGFEYVDASFSHSPWWRYGWSSPADYERYGNGSREPHNGVMRTMDVSDPGFAPAVTLGATVALHRHARLGAYARWSDPDDVDVTFRRRIGNGERTMRTGSFPAGHTVYGIALGAIF